MQAVTHEVLICNTASIDSKQCSWHKLLLYSCRISSVLFRSYVIHLMLSFFHLEFHVIVEIACTSSEHSCFLHSFFIEGQFKTSYGRMNCYNQWDLRFSVGIWASWHQLIFCCRDFQEQTSILLLFDPIGNVWMVLICNLTSELYRFSKQMPNHWLFPMGQ